MTIIKPIKTQKLKTENFSLARKKNSKNKHYFIYLAIPLALSFWLLDSFTHYFIYGESEFEIIPSDNNDLWMRISISILLVSFGLFSDFRSKKIIEKNNALNLAETLSRAKKQWELAVDSLPQLVIAMDDEAKIIRVNRTIEAWGIGKVTNVDGLYILDFLKLLDDNNDDSWISDWDYLWQCLKDRDTIIRKVEKKQLGKVYLYTLKKIFDYKPNKDQFYAVLVIDDITTRQEIEKSLKDHALQLEKKVNDRTLLLNQTNEQLERELQIQKQAKDELKDSQQCRINLLRDLFSTQETERKRISRELHDSLGQSLSATKFKVEELLINKQNFYDEIEYNLFANVVDTIRDAIDEVRHIAMDLRPAMLDDLGILATLQWFVREFENTFKNITVESLVNIDESDIPEDRKVVIFRIVQEAMNNITKHANARNIVLNLFKSDSSITLFISDNGCGFNMDTLIHKKINQLDESNILPRCSFGLSSMRERAESTNGTFVIESSPGGGTTIIISWEH